MADFWNQGPEIDGIPGKVGDLVFWAGNSRVPWWIAEWQPTNGRCFAIINAMGDVGVAAPEDLSRNFRDAHASSKDCPVFSQENLTQDPEWHPRKE